VPTSSREHPAERSQEGAIGRSERRPRLLPTKHQYLMAQNQQLDVLGELAAAAAHEQPQQRRKPRDTRRKEASADASRPPPPPTFGTET